MSDRSTLARTLNSLDGRGYAGYKQLRGAHDLSADDLDADGLAGVRLVVDHVQVDPYAPPSLMRVQVDRRTAALPEDLLEDARGRTAVADFLTRRIAEAAKRLSPTQPGDGSIGIGRPGQQVIERTSVVIGEHDVETRLHVALPASGRRIRGRAAARLLTETLPRIVESTLRHEALEAEALREHVTLHRDQQQLRHQLAEAGLVAFVGDGAVLPRRSGDSDLPLATSDAVPFRSPESLRVSFTLSSGRQVSGMGIPEGITVIIGGGYHGKSTLLRAIERGVHPHLGGDGREWVVTRPDTVAIRAEDGRAVTGVDISPFIGALPSGTDTRRFSTTNASGSTSQAAALVEAVEAQADALLIDEDTSATNFMIRDDRMRRLIPAEQEPITPFVDRIRPLHAERGVSTILVAGGSGAFFDVADHVIALDSYVPRDVTEQARALADPGAGAAEGAVFASPAPRVPEPDSPRGGREPGTGGKGGRPKPARARGRAVVQQGKQDIDLSAVSQLVDPLQTSALAHALDRASELADGRRSVAEIVEELIRRMDADGLDALSPHDGHPGAMARPRRYEFHAALNRHRSLRLV
ncbi:ABC-ATPase domain-containing protein [Nesterenkonia sp. HG001]|uniref:ABC-ATPase domain-containing protein n=1 Tax=Nesterenkonia sp. HG001 TaxID=2983207 RepID=UPI002AC78992|nr:ABC-ATPase domain-containing protein [Nesterenkonia sp. HG001]MDZ5077164.1 ABC-ATPase domain-containing protein [Nesterenkonia sp. HG001]